MLSSLRGTTMSGECPFRSFYVGAAISRPLLEKPELLEQRADNIRPYKPQEEPMKCALGHSRTIFCLANRGRK